MASQTTSCGASDQDASGVTWSDIANIYAAGGGVASVLLAELEISNWLNASNFGASIPVGSTIDGIEYTASIRCAGVSTQLFVGSYDFVPTIGLSNPIGDGGFADYYNLNNTLANFAVGGPSDLNGYPWSVAEINGADSGVMLRVTNISDADTAEVDHVTRTVYYTPPVVAPVAAFSGTPTSGSTPLSVAFTDASTNTPTSWLWEKSSNGGSSWANFSSGHTTQNPPNEPFTEGTWAVRLTATNAGGSDSETKLAYITVTSASSPCIFAKGADCEFKPVNSGLECIYDNGNGCLKSASRHK